MLVLRWTFLGALIGTLLASPVVWYFGSPFDHSLRSIGSLIISLPLAYLIGLPPAFVTGVSYQFARHTDMTVRTRWALTISIGSLSSTYLIWIVTLQQPYFHGDFDVASLVVWLFFILVGGITTAILLRGEPLRSSR